MGLNLSWEKFNGVVGRGAPHNTALKHKPSRWEIWLLLIAIHSMPNYAEKPSQI
jgi:hypothetical protein